MTYAKHKTTQAEFVKAYWEAQDRKAWEKLKKDYPGIETVSFFNGMEYRDKLRNIPNNALRRAGLKPIRRNGMRKKEWKKMQVLRALAAINAEVIQPLLVELIPKRVEHLYEKFACPIEVANQENVFEMHEENAVHFERNYLGRVMIHKNEPFVRWE